MKPQFLIKSSYYIVPSPSTALTVRVSSFFCLLVFRGCFFAHVDFSKMSDGIISYGLLNAYPSWLHFSIHCWLNSFPNSDSQSFMKFCINSIIRVRSYIYFWLNWFQKFGIRNWRNNMVSSCLANIILVWALVWLGFY